MGKDVIIATDFGTHQPAKGCKMLLEIGPSGHSSNSYLVFLGQIKMPISGSQKGEKWTLCGQCTLRPQMLSPIIKGQLFFLKTQCLSGDVRNWDAHCIWPTVQQHQLLWASHLLTVTVVLHPFLQHVMFPFWRTGLTAEFGGFSATPGR